MEAPELQGFIGTLLETPARQKEAGLKPGTRFGKTGSEPSREILTGDVLSLRGEL
jgi:hypothetical protein